MNETIETADTCDLKRSLMFMLTRWPQMSRPPSIDNLILRTVLELERRKDALDS